MWGQTDFKAGDRALFSWGWATVEKPNKKTLRIRSDVMPQVTNNVDYSKVLDRKAAA